LHAATAAACCCLLPTAASAQQKLPVTIHGSNVMTGQYANMQGYGQELPPSFLRDDLRMTLSVYDIPVSASYFYTTGQQDFSQSVNHFRIYFDAKEMMRNKGLSGDILTAAARKQLSALQDKQEEMEGDIGKLSMDRIQSFDEMELLQMALDKAKDELEAAIARGNQEVTEDARTNYNNAVEKAEQAEQRFEQANQKLNEAEAMAERLMDNIKTAREKLQEVQNQKFDSNAARRRAELEAKKIAVARFFEVYFAVQQKRRLGQNHKATKILHVIPAIVVIANRRPGEHRATRKYEIYTITRRDPLPEKGARSRSIHASPVKMHAKISLREGTRTTSIAENAPV
jgi:hypothetical protein